MADEESRRGELRQRSAWVVQQLEGLIASVDEGRDDLEVVDPVDLVRSGQLQGKTWHCGDSDRGRDEGDQCRAESGSEHPE